jgi:hypothetical protein
MKRWKRLDGHWTGVSGRIVLLLACSRLGCAAVPQPVELRHWQLGGVDGECVSLCTSG